MPLQSNFSRYRLFVTVYNMYEQHPIPQDVTGFQFKLIGTMTVKQFGYVAVGAILAAVSWYLPAQGLWLFLTRGLFVPFFSLSGVIIAFVPIEGRPVDVMAKNFLHTLISPNQYIYIKKGKKFSFTQITYTKKIGPVTKNTQKARNTERHTNNKKEEQLRAFLAHTQSSQNSLDKKEADLINTITSTPTPPLMPQIISTNTSSPIIAATAPTIAPLSGTPTPPEPKTPTDENLATRENKLQQELAAAKQLETIQKNAAEMNNAHQKVLELQKQIEYTHAQKEQLEQELLKLKNQLSTQKPTLSPTLPAEAQVKAGPPAPQQDPAHVRNVPQNMTKSAGFSQVPDTPNVIVGIVKDARGNILPNILVEVKDKNGNPVRAFKTNALGQFMSATPLVNDTYTIELEDPKKQHAFDAIQINASGQIMSPIEIISHDAREELRKALFN